MGDYTGCELDVPVNLPEETVQRIAAAFAARTEGDTAVADYLRDHGHVTGFDFRVGDELDFATELREIDGFPFTLWTSPKYEYLGTLVKYTARLPGFFVADCTDSGDIVLSNVELCARLDRAGSVGEVREWVRGQLGCAWDEPSPAPDVTAPDAGAAA